MSSNEKLVIGIILSPHGLNGKFKVESTSGECEHFFKLDEVTLRNNSTEQNFKVESVEGNVNSLLMKLDGIDSLESAKNFVKSEILVPRDKACPLNEDEFYIEDLKQCKLVYYSKNDETELGLLKNEMPTLVVGTIIDVMEGGAGQLLQVELSESLFTESDSTDKKNAKKTAFVPFNKEFIGTVDIKDKVVQLMHLWILE